MKDHGTVHATLLTGTFPDRESAESAYDALIHRGYTGDEVGVMMSPETHERHFTKVTTELGSKSAAGGATGAAIGGITGAIVGVLAAAGTLAIPGIGVVLAGPLVAGLAGLGAGSAAGGLIGALIGLGIPEERAKVYETDVKSGGIVLAVTPRTDEDAADLEDEWKQFRGQNIYR